MGLSSTNQRTPSQASPMGLSSTNQRTPSQASPMGLSSTNQRTPSQASPMGVSSTNQRTPSQASPMRLSSTNQRTPSQASPMGLSSTNQRTPSQPTDALTSYLQTLISPYTPTRPLRSTCTRRLALPPLRSPASMARSFSILAPQWWNDLPTDVRTAQSLTTYRRLLKTDL
ncbi:hypothetical protein EOD39_10216 [Acipenser ruthenus]|uniref:Uncharacterized protein n=1 Tax=Acipenser ruthenus TaxID=7906 RepID=A0A444TYB9_ACIRT|nr:hypothetical protein EOD39_10216 [Acipenser ruthenus]